MVSLITRGDTRFAGPNGSCCQVSCTDLDESDTVRPTSEKELADGAPVPELEPMVHVAMRRFSAHPYAPNNTRTSKRVDLISSSSSRRASMPVVLANRRYSTAPNTVSTSHEFRANHRKFRGSDVLSDHDTPDSSRALLNRRPLLGSGCSLKQMTADL